MCNAYNVFGGTLNLAQSQCRQEDYNTMPSSEGFQLCSYFNQSTGLFDWQFNSRIETCVTMHAYN